MMLVGLLGFVFDIAIFVLSIASWVVVLYVIMMLVAPDNKYTQLLGKYVEPLLAPVRTLLKRFFPKMQDMRVDVSPIGLWLLLNIAEWLLRLLKGLLL